MPMLVAGSKSGHLHVVAADSGREVQSLLLGPGRAAIRGFFSSKPASSSLVTGVSLCPDGAVISSFAGVVRFAGFA